MIGSHKSTVLIILPAGPLSVLTQTQAHKAEGILKVVTGALGMLASGIVFNNVFAARASSKCRSHNDLLFSILEQKGKLSLSESLLYFLFESNTNITLTTCFFVTFPRTQTSETKIRRMTE